MEAPHLERKLVAIMAADVEGFSRHMERDEAATLSTLSGHRLIIDASISDYGGRITGTAGDSVLAEFGSVLSAVNCAVQIQQLLAEENAKLDSEHRLMLRIGVNVGDVMVKDGDIFGDGVNIAARLESLAEPGGICVSRGVRDHLRKHRIVVFEDLGEQKVKNIAQPIRAFKVKVGETPADEEREPAAEDVSEDLGPALPTPQSGDGVEVELALWDSIKDSENDAEFDVYLERYPDGPFAVLAKTRREALHTAPARGNSHPAEPHEEMLAVELAFWEAAKDSENPAELEAYLERFSSGEFVALAQARLDTMREAAADAARGNSRPAEPQEETLAVELAFWEAAKDSENPAELEAYLERFSSGEFVALAQARLDTMREAAADGKGPQREDEPVEVELTFWNSVKDSGNPDMFRAYLHKYPKGVFAELAQINIETSAT